jgi:hypothetical protein
MILEKIFGPNWRTSFYGLVAGVVAFLATYPEALDPLPDYWERLTKQVIAFSIGAGLFQLGRSSRDNKVSEAITAKLEKKIEEINQKSEKF